MVIERIKNLFWTKVHKTKSCWFYMDGLNHNGYGQFWTGTNNVRAHRFSYEILIGPIPKGMQLDHICRNRNCVNPKHLEVVTQKENVLRGIGLTAINSRKKFCIRGHPLTPENTYNSRKQRTCKKCRIVSVMRYKKKRQEALI